MRTALLLNYENGVTNTKDAHASTNLFRPLQSPWLNRVTVTVETVGV